MSGWDTSSTHTWGQQDGPDETQAFAAPGVGSPDFGEDYGSREFGRMAPGSPPTGFPEVGGGFPGERSAAGPPPEFFGSYGQQDQQASGGYPQRTPGRSLHDLPQRNTGPAAQDAGYGQDAAYGQEGGFGQDNGYGQGPSYGQEGGYGQGPSYGQEGGYGQDWGAADQGDGWSGGRTAGRGAPWADRGQRDAGYQDPDGGFGRQDPGQFGYGGQDGGYGGQDGGYGGQDNGYGGQDGGYGQDYPGQQGRGPERSPYSRGERETAARSDPALQDFFAPQSGYAPPPGDGPGYPREQRPRPDDESWGGWDGPARPQPPQPPRAGTGPRPVPRAPRNGGGQGGGGLGTRGFVVIGVVVAVIIVLAVVVLNRHHGGGTPSAGSTPSGSTMTSAAAKPSAKATAMTTTYKLSTPATAGGYPQGQDPHFLATAATEADSVVAAAKSGGGGTVTGTPVSAAYQLPDSQVMTFVGYQGTFTPAKITAILAKLGSDSNTYAAGPNGGMLGCFNTAGNATTTSGAVCIWATTSTLGVTEFFNVTGPEALTQSQDKGAADTLKFRADVEAKA